MKKQTMILVTVIFSMITLSAIAQDVQLIAIHMGTPENMTVLDKTEFPDFEFYYNDAELIKYNEEQKLVGYNTNLKGLYGEVPEKMGFSANYIGAEGKYQGTRYYRGALFVVDPSGTIGYQSPPRSYISVNDTDIPEVIRSKVRKFKKGKLAKKLKASKQTYIKKAPVGEIERYKGSKVDKSEEAMIGWDLPDLNIKNENNETVSLKELVQGKVSVIVFYTLNGIHYKDGNRKGNIVDESYGGLLMSPKEYAEKIESKVMNADVTDKKSAKKAFAKTMFKAAVASSDNLLLQALVNSKEELNDVDKVKSYKYYTELLTITQNDAERLKK